MEDVEIVKLLQKRHTQTDTLGARHTCVCACVWEAVTPRGVPASKGCRLRSAVWARADRQKRDTCSFAHPHTSVSPGEVEVAVGVDAQDIHAGKAGVAQGMRVRVVVQR